MRPVAIATAPPATPLPVPTPPPEFDLEAWLASIDRLQAEHFDALYLTHFGRVDDVDRHWNTLRDVLRSHAQFVRQRIESGEPRDTMIHEYVEWNRLDARAHGIGDADFSRYVSRNLLTMNVDGMRRYWSRRLGIDQA